MLTDSNIDLYAEFSEHTDSSYSSTDDRVINRCKKDTAVEMNRNDSITEITGSTR